MTKYSQNDPAWKKKALGSTSIGAAGCFVTSLGMLANIPPTEVIARLKGRGGLQGAQVVESVAARLLGLAYEPRSSQPKQLPCIAETNYYRHEGYPQHFFVYLGDGRIVDPLDGQEKANLYAGHIVSYRNITPKGASMEQLKNERMNARADAMRFAWQSWNPGEQVDMSSIYREATAVEDGTLNQEQLINRWRDTAIAQGKWRKL